MQKDEEFQDNLKEELYDRIAEYIPDLKANYGITDEELDILLDGYVRGYFGLPPNTPRWIKELFNLT